MCNTIKPNKLQETADTALAFKWKKKNDKIAIFLPIKWEHSIHVLRLAFFLQEISRANDRRKSHYKREYASSRETWNQYPIHNKNHKVRTLKNQLMQVSEFTCGECKSVSLSFCFRP